MGYNPIYAGPNAKASSRSTSTGYQNGAAFTLALATPVSVNSSGQIVPVNVADEATVKSMVGYAATSIPSAAFGQVVATGRLENVQSSFPIGTPLWIGANGLLTNVAPDLAVSGWASGYFIVFVGVIVQNEFNSALQDLQILTQVIGQL